MGKSKNAKNKRLPGPSLPKLKPVNPFNLHQNRKKFTVLGQKVKGSKGLPGVSRQKSFDNRSKTLLVEYLNRNKANTLVDRRLGEKDTTADQGLKDDMRRVEHLKRSSTKHTLYNLSDDTEVLTHGGVPITEETLKTRDFDDELDEDGMLDAQFVKKQHFGGASLSEAHDLPHEDRKYKSQKDRIDEIVAESKMRKLQAKQDHESQRKKVEVLDSQFKNFMEMMRGNLITHSDKKKARREDSMRDYDRLMHAIAADGGPRSNPSERLKTEEELAKEKKQELEALEADRLRRMRGEYEDDGPTVVTRSADSLDKGTMKQFDERPLMAYKNGELLILNAEGKAVTMDGEKPTKKLSKEERRKRRKQQRMEKKMRQEEKKLLDDYLPSDYDDSGDDDGTDSFSDEDQAADDNAGDNEDEIESSNEEEMEQEDEDEIDDDDDDNYSDILEDEEEECEENDDDEETAIETETQSKKLKAVKSPKASAKAAGAQDTKRKRVSFSFETEEEKTKRNREMQEEASKELPYTLEVPGDYNEFWAVVEGRTPEELATLLERMIATNHPELQHANLVKCGHIFAYVLQLIHGLCGTVGVTPHPQHPPLSYLDPLTPHLYNLARLAPVEAAKAFLLVFIEKRDEYRDRVKKRYPTLDTLVFLQLAGVMYPASDFYHPVMTPVKLFLTQLLGEAKMKTPRDVLAALYCATVLLDYNSETKRYSSELLTRLLGLVLCCVPTEAQDEAVLAERERSKLRREDLVRLKESHTPLHWIVHATLPPPEMLPLTTAVKISTAPPKFELSMLNDANLILSDQFRCTVLLTCLTLLRDLCSHWAELPSVREALSPLHQILLLIPTHLYPNEVLKAKEELEIALNKLPPHPPKMRINRGRPKPLRMYEPLVLPMKAEAPRNAFNKSGHRALKQKLLHCVKKERKAATREIKKDNLFLAQQKLKETLASDAERKRKVNIIMNDLRHQEGEHKKYQKMKPGKRI